MWRHLQEERDLNQDTDTFGPRYTSERNKHKNFVKANAKIRLTDIEQKRGRNPKFRNKRERRSKHLIKGRRALAFKAKHGQKCTRLKNFTLKELIKQFQEHSSQSVGLRKLISLRCPKVSLDREDTS